ncbi:MAG: N-acetylmuramoyl-L-alanine amidase [Candidatus Peribacteraceae bacterium]|nr:N-acetylmuramoyl-L-alanine amidase [Candidatus Peribacteraceae bacterium]
MQLRSSSLACAFAVVALMMTSSGLAEAIAQPLNPPVADSSTIRYFIAPLDALSARLENPNTDTLDVSAWNGKDWTDWQTLEVDSDVDAHESTLVFFDVPTTKIRLRGSALDAPLHPITISYAPTSYKVASLVAAASPHILSRSEWGADDSFLFNAPASSSSSASSVSSSTSTAPATPSQRVTDCQTAQQAYADQFALQRTVTKDSQGRTFRWPLQYSKKVDLLIVHHTALEVQKTGRTAVDRVRALYAYHTNSLGWGDVGYNFVIDESGQIYEGKYGGRFVVGGHSYCNNINTLGVALMGNFELEQPSQKQVQALQWLLKSLSQEYGINVGSATNFHGKSFASRIIRHRDVLSTACPGYYLATAFPQVVSNVVSDNIAGSVKFPDLPPVIDITKPASPSSSVQSSEPKRGEGELVPVRVTQEIKELKASGGSEMRLNPGGQQRFDLVYTAPLGGVRGGSRIAQVVRSSSAIGILEESEDGRTDVRGALTLPQSIASGEQYRFQLLLTAPLEEGNFWFEIGGIRYTLKTSGRRSRLAVIPQSLSILTSPTNDVPLSVRATVKNKVVPVATRRAAPSSRSSSKGFVAPVQRPEIKPIPQNTRASVSSSSSVASSVASSPLIRIRLSLTSFPIVTFTNTGFGNEREFLQGDSIVVRQSGNLCQAVGNSNFVEGEILRLKPAKDGFTSVDSVRGKKQTYRGVIECRIIDGQVAFINELPMEDYLKGLAEEGDSQPLEKQKAFAVAARSYAAYYLSPTNRKYAGKPYDGDDSPASFQSYMGYIFEQKNPRWVLSVSQTAGKVLKKNGEVIKTPYFSSDDGRTRSIEESTIKIKYPEIYVSKPDPWCVGMKMAGHGVGMSGCGALGQAKDGKTYEQILSYYYPGTALDMYLAQR